jgi:tetratricopeptide (TPR) repeat protein
VPNLVPIDPDVFVQTISPLLERRDVRGMVRTIQTHWSMSQVVELLDGDDVDAQKVAALALSLMGTECCLATLAKQLKHPDRMCGQMAEHAMWAIWHRCGNSEAQGYFNSGSAAFAARDLERAIRLFGKAINADPNFAEAYNHRAMVFYLQENFEESLKDCQIATELMPLHFGAWAGAGHCHACLGHADEAIACYEKAKSINPHLECVDDLIAELRESL